MDKQALADITVFNKYARYLPQFMRRENWSEITDRNCEMHVTKYPALADDIRHVYNTFVKTKRVLPSMRSMQFGGKPILMAENRIYNCAYAPAEDTKFFSELMFLLLGGTGMGYSVQKRHVSKLPKVKTPESDQEYRYQVQDSIVGWADAVKVVAKAFFKAGTLPIFDYRDIRDKGTDLITTGGKAPGPEPLRICIEKITEIFRSAVGRRLTTLEVHDIACHIADSVRAGGIRRAAMIALFDPDDELMLTCKFREHFDYSKNLNLQRARANNSAILLRGTTGEKQFRDLMVKVRESGSGEPGVYWTNDLDWGTNPCCEIALRPHQMCNLTTINAGKVQDQTSFNAAASAAAFIGTLQAGYTDFHYLSPRWKLACEEEALLGISMTDIAANRIKDLSMTEAIQCAVEVNRATAYLLGINPAARVGAIKPEGTASLAVGGASGVHAWHSEFYIRRARGGKDEALVQYMLATVPELVEDDVSDPKGVVMSFPQRAPTGAILRTEPMINLLERVKKISQEWIAPSHISGMNRHNVSCTIGVQDHEWDFLTDWMWANREYYNGISVFPADGGTVYPQMPFEDITEEQYFQMLPSLKKIDIGQVRELSGDKVDLQAEPACAGGVCEFTAI